MKKETFEVAIPLQLENSFGVIKAEDSVKIEVTVGMNSAEYGWFELYDIETGGDDWYAEGGLWFKDNALTDYDGVFSLLPCIVEKLKEWGYDVSFVED
jgi:hypothetical protein